jgi:hypothetical protein
LLALVADGSTDVYQFGLAAPFAFPAIFLLPAQVPVLMMGLTAERATVWRAVRYALTYGACYLLVMGGSFLPYAFDYRDELPELWRRLAMGGGAVLGVVGLSMLIRPWSGWAARALLPVVMGVGYGLASLGKPYEWTGEAFRRSFWSDGNSFSDVERFLSFGLGVMTVTLVAALVIAGIGRWVSAPQIRRNTAVVGGVLLVVGAIAGVITILVA